MTVNLFKIVPTETDRVLAEMLTQNTGTHMLDSGGAYGRNFERNAGRDVKAFLAAPEVTWGYGFEYATVDVFHWLRERLEFDPTMDRQFTVWERLFTADTDGWIPTMESFAAKVQTGDANGSLSGGYLSGTTNSYNHEDSLSQTIQFTLFERESDGTTFVALQIHGGCDIRGGYTAPRIFRVIGDEAADMYEFSAYTLGCGADREYTDFLPGMPEAVPHVLDMRNGEWVTYEGESVRNPWEGKSEYVTDADGTVVGRACPFCFEGSTPMDLYPSPVG